MVRRQALRELRTLHRTNEDTEVGLRTAPVPSIRPKRDGRHRFLLGPPVEANPGYGSRSGWEADMSERRITQLFGLILGAIVSGTLVLNAFAF
jgi:hypothetical protein